MIWTLIALMALLSATPALAGPLTVICNGDSNTQSDWQKYSNGTSDGWCERLGVQLGVTTINRGIGGSTISDNGLVYGVPLRGGYYIEREIDDVDPFDFGDDTFAGQPVYRPFPTPDVVILAFGTNDLNAYGYTPAQVISAIKKYRRKIIAAGAIPYVATTPPMFNADGTLRALDATIKSLNKKIRGNWPARYVEFYNGMVFTDYQADGLHLTAGGQAKRAQAAVGALLNVHALRVGP